MPGPISTERMIAARGMRWRDVGQFRARARCCRSRPACGRRGSPSRRPPPCPPRIARRDLHVDLGRRAAGRAQVGEVGHRDDRQAAGGGRDRPALGMALGAAVVERQQEQQDHADRRDPDRRDRDQLRRLDHAQDLEEEEEVPLGARHVGGRRRVRLRALLGAEDDRHRDDHGDDDQRHRRVLHHRVGEERLALLLQELVLLEVCLLVGWLHEAADAPLRGRGPVALDPGVELGDRRRDLSACRRAARAARWCRA